MSRCVYATVTGKVAPGSHKTIMENGIRKAAGLYAREGGNSLRAGSQETRRFPTYRTFALKGVREDGFLVTTSANVKTVLQLKRTGVVFY